MTICSKTGKKSEGHGFNPVKPEAAESVDLPQEPQEISHANSNLQWTYAVRNSKQGGTT